MERELMSEEEKSNSLQRCVDTASLCSLNHKYIARTYLLCVGCPEAPALVQVMELAARYKTINYMVMSTQDC